MSFTVVYLQYEDVWAEEAALSMVCRFATSEKSFAGQDGPTLCWKF